jgi:hypothetical protein
MDKVQLRSCWKNPCLSVLSTVSGILKLKNCQNQGDKDGLMIVNVMRNSASSGVFQQLLMNFDDQNR